MKVFADDIISEMCAAGERTCQFFGFNIKFNKFFLYHNIFSKNYHIWCLNRGMIADDSEF